MPRWQWRVISYPAPGGRARRYEVRDVLIDDGVVVAVQPRMPPWSSDAACLRSRYDALQEPFAKAMAMPVLEVKAGTQGLEE